MLASDWSRGRGWFLTPVGMYNDVQVVNRMYIYIRNLDPSFFGQKTPFKNTHTHTHLALKQREVILNS